MSAFKKAPGIFALSVIGLMAFIAVFAYLISPDTSPSANTMNLALATMPPGSKIEFVQIQKETPAAETSFWERLINGTPAQTEAIPIREVQRVEGGYQIIDFTTNMPRVIPESKFIRIEKKTFFLGTDRYGRDVLSRLFIATRVSFLIGSIAVLISLLIGVPLGLIAGYYGGIADRAIMWLVNVMWSVPGLLLVIAFTLALGKGLFQVFLAIGLTMWVEVARLVRGQVKSLRSRSYVEVAKMMGFPARRIMIRHILPGVLHPVIVVSAANFATAILLESGLSFLGYGAQPPTPTWGGMVKDHWPFLLMGKAHLVLWPGLCIVLLVLACMFLGNALRDQTDPRKQLS